MASYNHKAYSHDNTVAEDFFIEYDSRNEDDGFNIEMLCCSKNISDCICKDPVDFYSALSVIEESLSLTSTEVAYAAMPDNLLISACESCLKYGSDQCPSFKEWVQDIHSKVELGKNTYFQEDFMNIYPCNLYDPSAEATDEDINQVFSNPKFNQNIQ